MAVMINYIRMRVFFVKKVQFGPKKYFFSLSSVSFRNVSFATLIISIFLNEKEYESNIYISNGMSLISTL